MGLPLELCSSIDVRAVLPWLGRAVVAGLLRKPSMWATGAALVAVGLALWEWWPTQTAPAPRARQYRDVDACLLTDDGGVAGAVSKRVWAGMQDASSRTSARVSYLAVAGAQTRENASPYLASLVVRRCSVVVAVGDAPVAAVGADASRYSTVRFIAVGKITSGANVSTIDPGGDVRGSVRYAVAAAAPQR
jgi:hypothetical protein